ncbi:MAG: hypothetical protein WB930_04570 [Syntrophobacteraceae bacterium]
MAEPLKYIFVDGVNLDMRMGDSIETIPVLVAIEVTDSGLLLGNGHPGSLPCRR